MDQIALISRALQTMIQRSALSQPVFDPKIINPRELTLVVGYQREAQGQRVSRYQQVVCADRLADTL
jgi:hypothetical protein